MKLVRILHSQLIRFLKVSAQGGFYGKKLVQACEERYGFLQAPRALADFDLSKGVTFLHGYFDDRLLIEKFQVFENGVLVECPSSTEDAETFVADVTLWAHKSAGIDFEDVMGTQELFISSIEVELLPTTWDRLVTVQALGSYIGSLLEAYGQPRQDVQLTGIAFSSEQGSAREVPFKVERRIKHPFSGNLFFSSAPLRTRDHLEALTRLEALLA